MSTGENETDLRKMLDLTRIASIMILVMHFYFQCYTAFKIWNATTTITDRILFNIAATGLFKTPARAKLFSLLLLGIAMLGIQGKKDPSKKLTAPVFAIAVGIICYFASTYIFYRSLNPETTAVSYILVTASGYLLILQGVTQLTRQLRTQSTGDIFNAENETFPQEERLLQNEYSINFLGRYQIKGKYRDSHINIINPFRGTLVTGSPGAGKSWFIILPLIKQQIEKGYALFIYDFKYDDLSKAAYNWLQQFKHNYAAMPSFYSVNFDNLSTSHRCNPLDPQAMFDITDASESARTILMGLNREWIKKQGDFFVESPINYVTAIIWFLRKYQNGKFCTLPHVIELMQAQYEELLPILNTEPEIEVLVNPFITAYQNDAMEQLEGQVASAKIGVARLASPQLYWVLSGNDFTLDINNPTHPKIVCMGNNPEKQSIYGAVLSLYVARLIKIVNKKGKQKCGLNFDEFPTIYFNNMDSLIATARSNKVATTLAMQDYSQLRKDYGKEQADVITNICGNIISGQVTGDTAKSLSERFGKIMQDRESLSSNSTGTSVSRSKHLDSAVPTSKIASLSAGEFVGMVSDNPDEKIKLKMFHAEIINDTKKLNAEMAKFVPIPVVSQITPQEVSDNFFQIKYDIKQLIEREVAMLIELKNRAEQVQ